MHSAFLFRVACRRCDFWRIFARGIRGRFALLVKGLCTRSLVPLLFDCELPFCRRIFSVSVGQSCVQDSWAFAGRIDSRYRLEGVELCLPCVVRGGRYDPRVLGDQASRAVSRFYGGNVLCKPCDMYPLRGKELDHRR